MRDTRSIRELIACQKPGWSLEQRFYTDPEIYALELEHIVYRSWVLAGHESQLPETGDFRVLNCANESAIIVRSKQGDIRAFANVCRHRGSIVCLEEKGNRRKFECPYHGWMYGTDGSLLAARSMPDGFDKADFGLHSLPVEIIQGLIFVCFCDDPPSVEAARSELAEPMAMFDFENLKVAAQKTYPIDANWKLAVENYQECYHCAPAHPEYAKLHTLMLGGKQRKRVQSHMLERMGSCGLKRIEFDHIYEKAPKGEMGYAYSRSALFEGYKTGSKDGQPLAPLLGDLTDYDGGASDINFGPLNYFLVYSDHAVGYVFTPVEGNSCQCEIYWLVRGDAVEGKDYDVDELMWLWDVTTEADKRIIVDNWRGVNSRYYEPGPFSEMEHDEQQFVDWVLHELRRVPRFSA
jgi:Rieske 2Fe-2S family protein